MPTLAGARRREFESTLKIFRKLSVGGASFVERYSTALTRRLPRAASAALAVLLAVQVTWLVGTLTPEELEPAARGSGAALAEDTAAARKLALDSLPAAHLFGEGPSHDAEAEPRPTATVVAPDTSLNLTLTGIVLGHNGIAHQAIIATGGAERSYRPGEALETGAATLHAVYTDRVILDRDGQLETLRPRELLAAVAGATPPPFAQSAPAPLDAEAAPLPLAMPIPTDATVANVPPPQVPGASPVTNVIRLTAYRDGPVVGLRASPGRDSQAFRDLGLQAGDVITSVNGTALGGAPNGAALFRALQTNPTVSVAVLRQGIPQVVTIPTAALTAHLAHP
jgi:general secretion pathway protein C